jgi:ABC-2 type transport system permease protein
MGMIPVSIDINSNTEILYASLPIKRRTIIISRYISSIILVLITFVWAFLLAFLLNRYLAGSETNFMQRISFGGIFLFFSVTVLIISVIIPVIIKMGFMLLLTAGTFISAVIVYGFIMGVVYVISLNNSLIQLINPDNSEVLFISIFKNKNLIYGAGQIMNHYGNIISIPVVTAILALVVFVSIKISAGLFCRKEF